MKEEGREEEGKCVLMSRWQNVKEEEEEEEAEKKKRKRKKKKKKKKKTGVGKK